MLKSLLILSVIFVSQLGFAQQGTAKAFVALSPAGDFVGTMKSTGAATVTGNKVSAKNIVVDLKSMSTGLDLRDDHAKNKYMEVGKYPEAVLIEANGENGKGTGKLKFHGKENAISGTYTIQGGKMLNATFKIKLSDYGISDISYKGIGVEDEVKIEVQVPIAAAGAAPAAPAAAATPAAAAPKAVAPAQKAPAPVPPKKK